MARKDVNNYFSHDSNARNDSKLIRLRMKHGAAGYGVYFMILERLREEADYVSVKDYNTIAFDFRVDASLIKSVIEDFGLFAFTDDGKGFYSESFLRRMDMKDSVRRRRKEAAAARWGKPSDKTHSENVTTKNPQQTPSTELSPEVSAPVVMPQPLPSAPIAYYSRSIDEEIEEMSRSIQWKESVSARFNISIDQLDKFMADFALKCDKQHTSMQDARSHFCYWLQKQKNTQAMSDGGEIRSKSGKEQDYNFNGGFGGVDI